ncbi:hypothetical protein J2S74_002850 [Evansella vedderi]|uniref:Uncharacterized protein n=1 Tax=Evansella vedderi TaxID=38282 RepID=A0ABT9ZW57_9BACI|nr:hypothetical protein [Evansella vedderi]MDQ0255468.1 hypothetical protein [Evansella vedderi]
MLKVTTNQLRFLLDAIKEAEIEEMIGYHEEGEEPSVQDKEIKEMNEFLRGIKEGQTIEVK